jgi:hypothetical protein
LTDAAIVVVIALVLGPSDVLFTGALAAAAFLIASVTAPIITNRRSRTS